MVILPRRYREAAKSAEDIPIVQGLIESTKQRTWCLLRSFDELEREVWGWANNFKSQSEIDADPLCDSPYNFGDVWWKRWRCALERARRAQVPENNLTEEFRKYRRVRVERDPTQDPEDWCRNVGRRWGYYHQRRKMRYKWGRYFLSNMDWDWDLGTCMKRLFKIEKPNRVGPLPDAHSTSASSPAIDMDVVPGESWSILAEEARAMAPKEVKIAYKTKDGRTQYTSFVPASPSPGHEHPISQTAASGPSSGEHEIDKLETGASSSDVSQSEAHETTPVEAYNGDVEGKEMAYDVGVTEVRERGDVI